MKTLEHVFQLAFNSCQFRNSELFKVVLAVLRLAISTLICANDTGNAVSKYFLLTIKPSQKFYKLVVIDLNSTAFSPRESNISTLYKNALRSHRTS